jgi:hypothetical protein
MINVRYDQLKNKSSQRVTYGNPCYSIGSKANSIYFLNDRLVVLTLNLLDKVHKVKPLNVRNYCHQNIFISLHLKMHLIFRRIDKKSQFCA